MTYIKSSILSRTSPLAQFLKRFWIAILLLVFATLFLLSTIMYLLDSSYKSYTLLFPSAHSEYNGQSFSELYAEQRQIPVPEVLPTEWTMEERKVYYLIKELLYGPSMIRSYPFVPNDTKIKSLAIQNKFLYMDFNENLIKGKSEHYFNTNAVLALIEKVLRLNFQQLKDIYFTIDGMDIKEYRKNLRKVENPF